MLMLRNRTNAPPGGFWVTIPQANFNQQFWDFDSAVNAVVKLMASNPALASKHPELPRGKMDAEAFVDNQNALRVAAIPGAKPYVMEGGGAPAIPFQWTQGGGNSPSGASAAVGRQQPTSPPPWFKSLGNIATGVRTIADWLGKDGKPVENALAEKRAAICVDCPQNKQGDLTSFFTRPASELIRRQLSERSAMKLSTTLDDKLGICDACGCPIKLKVHCPVDIIKAHIPNKSVERLDARCWITKE